MLKINMMSGKRDWSSDGWVHIDAASFPHIWSKDIYLVDSFPPGTVDLLYCSHGIAYFSVQQFRGMLLDWFKAMATGGALRLATPDFDVLTKLYQTGSPFEQIKGPLYGEMKMSGDTIHHKTCYDERTLSHLLAEAGFVDIERYDHRTTCHPNTGNREDRFDDCSAAYINGHLVSLNMQCVKPF